MLCPLVVSEIAEERERVHDDLKLLHINNDFSAIFSRFFMKFVNMNLNNFRQVFYEFSILLISFGCLKEMSSKAKFIMLFIKNNISRKYMAIIFIYYCIAFI